MQLLTLREAASLLGCHPYSIYDAIYQDRLKAVKLRGSIRVRAEEVEKILKRRETFDKNFTVLQVARILTTSQTTILRLIHDRKLKATLIKDTISKTCPKYMVTPEDLENYVISLPAA